MPRVQIPGPYWFHFYSNEGNEPPHIHVDRERKSAKFWLTPVGLADNDGFSRSELRDILRLVATHQAVILTAWNEHHRKA